MVDMTAYPWLVGALLPPVISFLKGANWSTQVKRVMALAVSMVAAVATYFIQNGGWVGWEELIANWGIIYGLAQVTYTGFWEGTKVETAAESVGSKTPPDPGGQAF